MSKTASVIRIAMLLAAAAAAILAIMAEPSETSPTWGADFLMSKTFGFISGYVAYRLYRRWRNDPLIRRFEQWCQKADTEI